jgi:hypothetical protein
MSAAAVRVHVRESEPARRERDSASPILKIV